MGKWRDFPKMFWNRIDTSNQEICWPWPGARFVKTGYGKVSREGKCLYAHRVSWELTHGATTECVLHKCDNRICVNPNHLFTGSRTLNAEDKVAKGRQSRGTMLPTVKLTEQQAREIRESTDTQRALAAQYNIDPSTISRIKSLKRWKHA